MTDDLEVEELDPKEEAIKAAARLIAHLPPLPVPGAEDLPDEVRDGEIEE